jgi:cytosine/adenosine deaminase-related metal-dependent hydrolase
MVTVHTADAVVPVIAVPIGDGAVAVAAGRIVAVGRRDDVLAAHPRAEVRDWGGVLAPGLVNAHTHLQYTSFTAVGATPFPTYVHWADRFLEEYAARRDDDWRATALDGIAAGLRSGTTCFGDVVTDVAALDVLVAADVPGVAYLEIIGVDAARWEGGVGAEVTALLTSAPRTAHSRLGLSPHAPYSVAEPVLQASTALARRLGLRIHTHLAEIDSEDELYRTGTGVWADRIRPRHDRGWPQFDDGGVGLGAAEYAAACGLLGPDSHVAHGVYLDRDGRRLLADAGTSVALCPRSNLTVGIDPPPVADFLHEGAPFCVGTDSLGSNASLDLLADVALLRRLAVDGGYDAADLDRRLVAAATIGGAAALGLEAEVGALAPGRRADLAVFDVDPADPERALVADGAGRCLATVVGGELRHGG